MGQQLITTPFHKDVVKIEFAAGQTIHEMVVATRIGKKLERKIRKTAGISPIPNHNIDNGIQAKGEIGRKKWMIGLNSKRIGVLRPRSIPRGMPRNMAR